jgi:hypothetical protein
VAALSAPNAAQKENAMSTVVMDSAVAPMTGRPDQLAQIDQKLDLLTQSMQVMAQQVNYLMIEAEDNRRRQRMWEDLFADMQPIVKEAYNLAEEQMEEMQDFVHAGRRAGAGQAARPQHPHAQRDAGHAGERPTTSSSDAAPLTRDMVDRGHRAARSASNARATSASPARACTSWIQIVTSFSEEDVQAAWATTSC